MAAQGSGHKEEVYRSMYFTKFNILIWDSIFLICIWREVAHSDGLRVNLGCNLFGFKENDVSNEKGNVRAANKLRQVVCHHLTRLLDSSHRST